MSAVIRPSDPSVLRALARDQKCVKVDCICAHCGSAYRKRADRVRTPDYCCRQCRTASNAAAALNRSRKCETCGASFVPRQAQIRAGAGRYCSKRCALPAFVNSGNTQEAREKAVRTWRQNGNKVPSGPSSPNFRGRKMSGKYVMVWTPDRGYIQEHRLVAEAVIGRHLHKDEVVHHINHDTTDNRPENLAVMSRAEHLREHREDVFTARKAVRISRGQKLTVASVAAIKSDIRNGVARHLIANRHGITTAMVSYIATGKSWGHV